MLTTPVYLAEEFGYVLFFIYFQQQAGLIYATRTIQGAAQLAEVQQVEAGF